MALRRTKQLASSALFRVSSLRRAHGCHSGLATPTLNCSDAAHTLLRVVILCPEERNSLLPGHRVPLVSNRHHHVLAIGADDEVPTGTACEEAIVSLAGVPIFARHEAQNTQSSGLRFRALLTDDGDPRMQLYGA